MRKLKASELMKAGDICKGTFGDFPVLASAYGMMAGALLDSFVIVRPVS